MTPSCLVGEYLYGVVSRKATIWIFTAVKISYNLYLKQNPNFAIFSRNGLSYKIFVRNLVKISNSYLKLFWRLKYEELTNVLTIFSKWCEQFCNSRLHLCVWNLNWGSTINFRFSLYVNTRISKACAPNVSAINEGTYWGNENMWHYCSHLP
jgi:hypothetical protein